MDMARTDSMIDEKPFRIATHNGIITIRNPATGEHRTVKIATGKDGVTRWVSLFFGTDNERERDYRSFGRINRDGQVIVFQSLRQDGFYERLANLLNHPERFADRLEFLFEGRCRRCNRKLTNPESIESGIGPECRRNEQ